MDLFIITFKSFPCHYAAELSVVYTLFTLVHCLHMIISHLSMLNTKQYFPLASPAIWKYPNLSEKNWLLSSQLLVIYLILLVLAKHPSWSQGTGYLSEKWPWSTCLDAVIFSGDTHTQNGTAEVSMLTLKTLQSQQELFPLLVFTGNWIFSIFHIIYNH